MGSQFQSKDQKGNKRWNRVVRIDKRLILSKKILHYIKQNIKENKPFTLNKHIENKIINW